MQLNAYFRGGKQHGKLCKLTIPDTTKAGDTIEIDGEWFNIPVNGTNQTVLKTQHQNLALTLVKVAKPA